jgi:hypothetical protein
MSALLSFHPWAEDEMKRDNKKNTVEIRIFGSLRQYMGDGGFANPMVKDVGSEGSSAYALAVDLGIPPEKVEAVFCNGRVQNIYDPVQGGDRIALAPYGTPGPYRVFLGMERENRERKRREQKGHGEVSG